MVPILTFLALALFCLFLYIVGYAAVITELAWSATQFLLSYFGFESVMKILKKAGIDEGVVIILLSFIVLLSLILKFNC